MALESQGGNNTVSNTSTVLYRNTTNTKLCWEHNIFHNKCEGYKQSSVNYPLLTTGTPTSSIGTINTALEDSSLSDTIPMVRPPEKFSIE